MKHLFCFLFTVFHIFPAMAQKDYVWAFGYKAGLDFNTSPPQCFTSAIAFVVPGGGYPQEAAASVSDNNGNLLFYTEGSYIWDKNHNMMPNSNNLTGEFSFATGYSPTTSTSQGALIVPLPGSNSRYYVFSLSSVNRKLYYSEVNINLNGGLGDVVAGQKGILVDSGFTEQMTAVRGDNCNIWLLLHTNSSNTFKAFKILPSGLDPIPVTSFFNTPFNDGYSCNYMVAAPARNKVASSTVTSGITMYDFDTGTGLFSNMQVIDTSGQGVGGGIAFSPSGNKLYYNLDNYLYQTDISSGSALTKTPIMSYYSCNQIKLGPDQKLYLPYFTGLLRINAPDLSYPACDLDPLANLLPLCTNTYPAISMPNVIPFVPLDTQPVNNATTIQVCFKSSVSIQAPPGWEYMWEDGSTNPVRDLNQSGTYVVTYSAPPCTYYVDTYKVSFFEFPQIVLQPPCENRNNGSIAIVAPPGDTSRATYTWYNSTNQVLQVEGNSNHGDTLTHLYAGAYLLKIQTAGGCDTLLSLILPNAAYAASFLVDSASCEDRMIQFNNTSTNLSQFTWNFGDGQTSTLNNPQHSYANGGQYQVTLTGTSVQGCIDTAGKRIRIDSIPAVRFTPDKRKICTGDEINLEISYTSPALNFHWYFNNDWAYTAMPAQYFQQAYDRAGKLVIRLDVDYPYCPDTTYTDTIEVYAQPLVDLGPDTTLCLDGAPIPLINRYPSLAECSYLWNTGDTGTTLQIRHPGSYSLRVTSPDDCSSSDEIKVVKDCYIDIPNAFSPNGDYENDYFFPRQLLSKSVARFTMELWNRWGQPVFQTNNINGRGWDGKFNGQDQPVGVYLYKITVSFVNGAEENYTGNLTLIR